MTKPRHVLERLLSRIEIDERGCWVWQGASDGRGYGHIGCLVGSPGPLIRRDIKTHRVTYEALVGPIPDGLVIDHLCRNRACCNPDHLEPVTNRENILRGIAPSAMGSRRTHCVNGHEFTPANTSINHKGHRRCRACDLARTPRKRVDNRRRRANGRRAD